jgi:hypothetical protein
VVKFDGFMSGSNDKSYSSDYLGQIYAKWSTLNVNKDINIIFEKIKFNKNIGYQGKQYLINNRNWTIIDGGETE